MTDMRQSATVQGAMDQQWFTPDEAAEYLRVNRSTILRWTREGKLRSYTTGEDRGSRPRRYRREDLDARMIEAGAGEHEDAE